jgi:hypothetical protein
MEKWFCDRTDCSYHWEIDSRQKSDDRREKPFAKRAFARGPMLGEGQDKPENLMLECQT